MARQLALMTAERTARRIDISIRTLRHIWATGDGPRQTWIGGVLRVSEQDCDAWLASLSMPPRKSRVRGAGQCGVAAAIGAAA